MRLILAFVLCFLAAGATVSAGREFNPIRLNTVAPDLNSGRLQAVPSFGRRFVCNCESWRFAVEVNNIRNWSVVPEECKQYVSDYMSKLDPTETQYDNDLNVLTGQALDFLQELPPVNRNNTFLFGLMGTLLSDVQFYEQNNWGTTPPNMDQYYQWLEDPSSIVKATAYINQVYYAARLKGFKIVILSGSYQQYNDILESRLNSAGISGWDQLVLNPNASVSDREFKEAFRAELLNNGSIVVGNVGDQWSDLQGVNAGERVFKVPNPLYYIP